MRFLFISLKTVAIILGILSSTFVQAAENEFQTKELIGSLSVSDLLIQPQYTATEDDKNNFNLGRSYFFFSWKMNTQLSAHFGVGRQDLINHNSRLSINRDVSVTTSFDDFGFFEAYGQLDSRYGIIRAGIIPLKFGWEGNHRESEWIFPRTLFFGGGDESYSNQNFGLRDYGVSYFVSSKEFYTQAAFHNGENGEDLDGKIWHTAILGWKNQSGLEAGLSMSNGKFKSQSNTDPEYAYAYGNLFFGFEFYDLLLLGEGFVGKEEKAFATTPGESLTKKFWDWHIDISHPLKKGLSVLGRYEQYDPNSNTIDDRIRRYVLGLNLSNEFRTSNLYFWIIKNKEEGNDLNNDELMIGWKVRSLSIF